MEKPSAHTAYTYSICSRQHMGRFGITHEFTDISSRSKRYMYEGCSSITLQEQWSTWSTVLGPDIMLVTIHKKTHVKNMLLASTFRFN